MNISNISKGIFILYTYADGPLSWSNANGNGLMPMPRIPMAQCQCECQLIDLLSKNYKIIEGIPNHKRCHCGKWHWAFVLGVLALGQQHWHWVVALSNGDVPLLMSNANGNGLIILPEYQWPDANANTNKYNCFIC